ncbi:MAG: winged helix-turn-helix domain-containing protein, partial [Acetobacteraceae bacterium]
MIYVIGSCRIDTNTYEVHRDGVPVSVEPQVFDLLCFLVESRDRIVTRDEIVERVWNGRIVSDAAISGRIKAARRAIGDDGKTQSMIRTIHRRGIRFVGDVKFNDAEQDKPDTASEPVVARATSAGLPDTGSDRTLPGLPRPIDERDSAAGIDLSLPKRPSLVVLPFHVLSGDETGQMIADGLSLDIMTGLARTRWLFVIARGTAFKFRGPSQDAYDIAQRLGVRYVLQGTIQYRGNRLRIHAALIDAVDARAVWADHLDRTVDDIFLIQDELAGVVVRSVEGEIEQSERQRALLVPASSLDAWSAYHRGTWHMYQYTPQHYEEAERLFKIAASLDPSAT